MNEEMLKKLQGAKSVEEVIAIAKEYGQEVTTEQAQELLDRLKVGGDSEGELSDDALEAAAGGFQGYFSKSKGIIGQSGGTFPQLKPYASDILNRPV